MIHEFNFGTETIRYHVQRFSTRRTLGIEVHPDQRVLVRAPIGCPDEVISARIMKRAGWISRQIAEFQRYAPRTPARQYLSGETHLYLGRQYRLKVVAGDRPSVELGRGQLTVTMVGTTDPERVQAQLRRWYLNQARQVFGEVLGQCLVRFRGARPPRLIVRKMQSRWGSLSPASSMTLNADLVRAPRACIEYVVTHELCHLRHRDHDASFYRLLSKVMADWETRKRKLEAALI